MKKYVAIAFGLVLCFMLLTGCEKVNEGKYKEGTYYGSVVDTYGGSEAVASAVVYVDASGMIKSVFLDTTYKTDEGTTTKKALGEEYGMKKASAAGKEWYEQVNLLEAKVIENQDISFIKLDDDGKTDAVAGVTMKVNALYDALNKAIEQAK